MIEVVKITIRFHDYVKRSESFLSNLIVGPGKEISEPLDVSNGTLPLVEYGRFIPPKETLLMEHQLQDDICEKLSKKWLLNQRDQETTKRYTGGQRYNSCEHLQLQINITMSNLYSTSVGVKFHSRYHNLLHHTSKTLPFFFTSLGKVECANISRI